MDERIKKMASQLVEYSIHLQPKEKVLIDYEGEASKALVKAIIKKVYEVGGYPYVISRDSSINRELIMGCSEEMLKVQNQYLLDQMKNMDAYMAIRGSENTSELSDVPDDKLALWNKELDPVLRQRVDHTKWVVMRYPNNAMAQLAGTSLEQFEDFYFNVCTLDYSKMDKAMDPLVELMNKTDKVRLVGPGTDLSFSIKGLPAIKCSGNMNIPDGEVYTAPVKDSMNGHISYNTISSALFL